MSITSVLEDPDQVQQDAGKYNPTQPYSLPIFWVRIKSIEMFVVSTMKLS